MTEDKRDAAGTHYRRHRQYDPHTGRFTQEDPIGLAGGLNLYGFANGDPVNFSDPFGPCPWCIAYAFFEVGASLYDAADLAVTGVRFLRGRASGQELALTAGGASLGLVSFGGGGGRAARLALNRALGTAGEAAVHATTGLAKNCSGGPCVKLGSRIPDFVDAATGTFHEAKNVAYLPLDAQIREMVSNLAAGQQLAIHVRQGMRIGQGISKSFRELVEAGKVRFVDDIPRR